MVETTHDIADEFRRAAEIVEANRLDSDAWLASLEAFDVIKADTHPDVLQFAQNVGPKQINWQWLACLLRVVSKTRGSK